MARYISALPRIAPADTRGLQANTIQAHIRNPRDETGGISHTEEFAGKSNQPIGDTKHRNAELDPDVPRAIVLLGSTGSIGQSALRVIMASRDSFTVMGLAGGKNIKRLAEQANRVRPPYLAIQEEADTAALRHLLTYNPEILHGQEGYEIMASLDQTTFVLSAQSGAAGLRGTLAAAKAGKIIALANKESLVIAGELIRHLCSTTGATILPVDSEHNAIFQCLHGNNMDEIHGVTLTASGGPFAGWSKEKLRSVTPAMALKHPNWDMGAKITIDSASLMNKGLEVIEACHLYGLPLEQVHVVIHRQSIVHSLVEFVDGSYLAQLGTQDMRNAIGHCLHWPVRHDTGIERLNLLGTLTFEEPDTTSFPCLTLAREAMQRGFGYPTILNAANEIAVEAFLHEDIGFLDIPRVVEATLQHCQGQCDTLNIQELLALDQEARATARQFVKR